MINNNVILTVREESDIATVRELMVEQGRLSREEPGCVRFDVFHSQSEPRIFILIEQWESEQHLDAHREAQACTEIYKPKVLPLVDRVPHLCDAILD
jgi:quinol monooxygenase YgiN